MDEVTRQRRTIDCCHSGAGTDQGQLVETVYRNLFVVIAGWDDDRIAVTGKIYSFLDGGGDRYGLLCNSLAMAVFCGVDWNNVICAWAEN